MSHIFISYSKKNKDYAYALEDFLRQQGFNVWIDKVGIEYGVDWWDAIVDGLQKCGAFIILMTPESKASAWVKREVFWALDKRPVFPMLLNGENWELFGPTQYADVRDGSMPDADLLERLSQHVTPQRKHGENKSDLVPEKQSQSQTTSPVFDVDEAIKAFGKAFRAKNWSLAQEILGRIRASGEETDPFDPEDFERRVQAAVEAENREREEAALIAERDRQYQRLLDMSEYADNATLWAALQKFWLRFPDYDPQKIGEAVRPKPTFKLPDPFEWVQIPAGKVTLEDGHGIFAVAPFQIAKYPITVAQYTLFIEDKGYSTQAFWTQAGWDWKQKENINLPRYWGEKEYTNFFKPTNPIIGVSWYEAMAFCHWLSEKTGDHVTLPTEQQWQRAAQGDDGRTYPWGNNFDGKRCNNSVSPNNSHSTTPVTQYPNGASPYGVFDMSGNVWEWMLNEYDNLSIININNTERRGVRGGSWDSDDEYDLRADYRDWFLPNYGDYGIGVRLARS